MVDALRKEIKRLFAEEKVDIMIGWGKGSMALSSTPVFVLFLMKHVKTIWLFI
jgi:hypothetical protein